MGDLVEIREATEADFDALVKLNAEVQALHVQAMPWQFKSADVAVIKQWFCERLGQDDRRVVIAKVEGLAVGYAMLRIRQTLDHPYFYERRWLYIDQIGVAERYRERGIGQQLIEAATQMARDLAIDQIELDVWDFNAHAQRFFAAQGFIPATHKLVLTVSEEGT